MSVIDLLPTFASLAGAEPSTGRAIDGLNIADALLGRGEARSPRTQLYYYQQDELQAVRSGPWKLFLPLESPSRRHPHFAKLQAGEPLLFNLVEDVSTDKDVAATHPEVVERLMAIAQKARLELGDHTLRGRGPAASGTRHGPATGCAARVRPDGTAESAPVSMPPSSHGLCLQPIASIVCGRYGR